MYLERRRKNEITMVLEDEENHWNFIVPVGEARVATCRSISIETGNKDHQSFSGEVYVEAGTTKAQAELEIYLYPLDVNKRVKYVPTKLIKNRTLRERILSP